MLDDLNEFLPSRTFYRSKILSHFLNLIKTSKKLLTLESVPKILEKFDTGQFERPKMAYFGPSRIFLKFYRNNRD